MAHSFDESEPMICSFCANVFCKCFCKCPFFKCFFRCMFFEIEISIDAKALCLFDVNKVKSIGKRKPYNSSTQVTLSTLLFRLFYFIQVKAFDD